jgi:geranylgeranyl diphosphate synthase type I
MIEEELLKRARLVSKAIDDLLPVGHPQGLYKASRHLVDAGGKRLRPSMLLMAAEAAGGDPEKLAPAGVAVELVHNFTLIHDDIMDNADLRRGKPSVHSLWGISGAILAGDTLYSKAFQILGMTPVESRRIIAAMDVLSKTCTAICEGQWLDLEFERRELVSEREYMEMIEKKTGVLYGAAASMGAVLAGASEDVVYGLEKFGLLTGMGFQIHDDVLDLTAPEEVLGKRRGGDLVEGKKTLIIIHAMAGGRKPEAFGRRDATAEEIERAISLLEDQGSIDYARRRSLDLVEKGIDALDVLPESSAKALLLELADYMISRRY